MPVTPDTPAVLAAFGIDEMRGVATDIGALLDRLETQHAAHCVLAALQLATFRRCAEHQLSQPVCDALSQVAYLAWQREPALKKN